MIRVLVVEDSPTARENLIHLLESDPGVRVAGFEAAGEGALEAIPRLKPDVVTMDIDLPGASGLETTRRIMRECPVPVVIVSGLWTPAEAAKTFEAMEAGAVALVEKPKGPLHPDRERLARHIIDTVKLVSEVRVVRRWGNESSPASPAPGAGAPRANGAFGKLRPEAVLIGASTGGPPVLRTILAALPAGLPAPVLIAQHMSAAFVPQLAAWLASSSPLGAKIPDPGERLEAGRAYVAPGGLHLGVGSDRRARLSSDPPEHGGLRPAVSYLFRSGLEAFDGRVVGVLLTGMGKDGALELKAILDRGGLAIAQREDTCVVPGMPGEAIRLGGASLVLAPEEIAPAIERALAESRPRHERTP